MMRNLFFIGVLLPLSSNILASTLAVDNVQLGDVDSLSRSGNILISSYVYVVSDSSLTLQGRDGYITTGSSVSASSYFGDGTNLSGIPKFASTQNWTNENIFKSSFTVRSQGDQIVLSTGSMIDNLSISSSGIVTFYPELHNSSSTEIPDAQTTNQLSTVCVHGSTLAIVTSGGAVEIGFNGNLDNPVNIATISFLMDGHFVGDMAGDADIVKVTFSDGWTLFSTSVRYMTEKLSSGVHSFCLALSNNSSGDGLAHLVTPNHFFIKEIK
jgi:hypothetical protein